MNFERIINHVLKAQKVLVQDSWIYHYSSTVAWLGYGEQEYKINKRALKKACNKLDLPYIPEIRLASMPYFGRVMLPEVYEDNFEVIVEVNDRLHPYAVSFSIWHELAHCRQFLVEKIAPGRDYYDSIRALNEGDYNLYWNQDIEREARETELYGLQYKLIKGVK